MLAIRIPAIALLAACTLLPLAARAEENAALTRYGATIKVTCDHPKPLNDRWAKPPQMLDDKRPSGPIINDLASGRIDVSFPLPFNVRRVGLKIGDYHGGFARASEIEVQAGDAPAERFSLADAGTDLYFVDYTANAKTVHIRVTAAVPSATGQNKTYGAFSQVVIMVDDDVAALFQAPASYRTDLPTYIMRTRNLDPAAAPAVRGTPRQAEGHPCTIWDAQEIAELKQQIATLPAAKSAYERCLAFCDKVCKDPIPVPDKPDDGVDKGLGAAHNRVAGGIANLGIGYALSGNEAYAREAARILLDLADRYEGWPVHGHPKFHHDKSKWSWQRLGDAIWLIQAAWGFDLIYNSPSLTDADRSKIRDHFVMPCVRQIMSSQSIITAPTNWSVICCAAVMIGARVSGDQEFYEKSLYGLTRKPEDKKGGIYFHLDNGIDDDGMWAEGAIGYQFMAMRGLIVMAEILWHNGIDIWSYRNGRLKLVFDSPIWYCYPGGTSSPAIHDSGSVSLFGRDAHLYQYARRRYGDTTYNAILKEVAPSFESVYNLFLPACDFHPVDAADLPTVPSILFPGVGFATARTGAGEDSTYLLLDYGPSRSHGHPDKLNHCFYALGQELFADAGSAWYSTDIYRLYYRRTLAHNTVAANGMDQIMTDGRLEAYSQIGDLALIRASCAGAIPATILDRTLVQAGSRLYDVYLVRSGIPFSFELPYHSHGELEQTVATEPWTDCPKDAPGYAYFKDPKTASIDRDWSCRWHLKNGAMTMHALGESGTQVVCCTTPKGSAELGTVMLRRETENTVFATVADVVREGAAETVKTVARTATAEGYTLTSECADGARETILVSYAPGEIQLGPWKTDARVVFLRTRGKILTDFVLAGGTRVQGPGVTLTASAPALLAMNSVKEGLAQLANQGEIDVELTVTGLDADTVSALDAAGKRVSSKPLRSGVVAIAAGQTVDLARGKKPTVAEFRDQVRRQKQAAAAAEEARRQKELAAQIAAREAEARKIAVPADYRIVLQAEDFSAQGGGEVKVTNTKTAVMGTCFLGWDNNGHWIEYTFDVKHAGYYRLVLKYCREGSKIARSVLLDGVPAGTFGEDLVFPGTGGWSNGADNWELTTFHWPDSEAPFYLKLDAGQHTLRLLNKVGGGLNLDYLVLVPWNMTVSRQTVEGQ